MSRISTSRILLGARTQDSQGGELSCMRCACNASVPSRACVHVLTPDRAPLARDQVRCCSPTQLPKWKPRVCLGRVSCYSLGGWGCSREKTFAEADIICQAAGAPGSAPRKKSRTTARKAQAARSMGS
eukprot:scaffold3435_cov60-Phaeocystis_antarctica.AAC.2